MWTFAAWVATIAIWCAFDFYRAGPGAEWTGFGIAGLSWYVLCVLAFTWVLSRVAAPAMSFRAAAFTVAVALPFVTAAGLAIDTWVSPDVALWCYAAVTMGALFWLALRLHAARVPSLF